MINDISSYFGYLASRIKTLHLNLVGSGPAWLIVHEWLQELYERASSDYDLWAELAIECGLSIPDSGDVYTAVGATPLDLSNKPTVEQALGLLKTYVEFVCSGLADLYSTGGFTASVDNALTDSSAYWSKVLNYKLKLMLTSLD